MNADRTPFRNLSVDHVRLSVTDLEARTAEFVHGYGLAVTGAQDRPGTERSVALSRNGIHLVLGQSPADEHPDAVYTRRHGDGVSDIALSSADAVGAFTEAVRRGARPLAEPVRRDGVITASIAGFGDVAHTFVQRPAGSGPADGLPWLPPPRTGGTAGPDTGLHHLDHFAVCVESGDLEATVDFYRSVLDFRMIFEENIVVGNQGMNSQVVQSRSGLVTLTLVEPDTTREPGQLDTFLKNHGGAGVQHVAFTTDDVLRSVGTMRSAGVVFLGTPDSYYRRLPERLALSRYSAEDLGRLGILADEDHAGQLFQIFTRSTHARGTLFFEVIERAGATTFGSGNIRALYEAVEAGGLG